MKRNLVGKILGKIKIFDQDFVPIRTALIGLPFLRGLPTRVFFLPYAYRVVVFCLFLILLLFVFLFRVNYVSSVILPSEDVLCYQISCPFSSVCLPCVFFGMCSRFDLVSFRLSCDRGWIRSGSVNLRY